jgi:probable F420-dependent oxidoreductase
MNIGVIYPQTEFGGDPAAIRDFAQTAEALGYSHILTYDHVLGANPDRPGGWKGPYTYKDAFLEPFVLYTWMAAHTQKIGFTTGILVLGQRQTALVAKQAATLDVLSGGRLRLGVGNGWNEVEYISLGQDFHTRGKRIEEQVGLLRQLWTQDLVTFEGRFDTIADAGIKPLPVQRPIPIWFGGSDDRVLDRVARLGDGWMLPQRPLDVTQPYLDKLRGLVEKAGRTWSDLGLEARLAYGEGKPDDWQAALDDWKKAGATHISLDTAKVGFDTPSKHMGAIKKFAEAVGVK